MDFELNETQHLIQKTTRDYVERAVRPVAGELDRSERFPKEQLAGLAELGMMGVNIPAALGGAEAGAVSYALAMMEVARGCASTAVTMAVTNMVGEVITAFGLSLIHISRCSCAARTGRSPPGSTAACSRSRSRGACW